jgi:hypothetical protein
MRSADRPEAARLRSDASSAGERRALAARLLRLPDAHPSSPRDEAAPESQPEAADQEPWWPEDQAAEAEDLADPQEQEQEDQDLAADADDSADPDDPGSPPDQPGLDRPGTPEAGRRAVGRPSGGGARGSGSGEPYRPWFADGDGGGDPWFTGGL